jgi:hypothetical protein
VGVVDGNTWWKGCVETNGSISRTERKRIGRASLLLL